MAFPADYTLLRKIPIDATAVTGSNNAFTGLITEAAFKLSKAFIFANTDNGGGDVRFSTDEAGLNQIPIDIPPSGWDTIAETCQLWYLADGVDSAAPTDLYIWGDNAGDSQPVVTAAFGRNATWVDYEAVLHMGEVGTNGVFVDSTGNGHDTTLTTGSSLATTTTNNPFGGSWADFTGVEALTLSLSAQMLNNSALTVSAWVNLDVSSATDGVFSNNYASDNTNFVRLLASSRFAVLGNTGIEDTSLGGNISIGVSHLLQGTHDATSLDMYLDGALDGTDASISNTAGINATAAMDYRVGTYFNNVAARRTSGRIGEIRAAKYKLSAEKSATQYSNQNDVASFYLEPVVVSSGISIAVDSGTYSQTGTTTPINAQLSIITTAGSYLLTGSDVNLTSAKKLITETGSYNLTGTGVTLIYTPGGGGETLIVDSGVYSLAGDEVLLRADLSIIANSDDYSVAGTATPIKYNASIIADSGSYSLVGADLNLFANYGMIAVSNSYSLTGASVTLKYSGDTNQVIGTVTAGFAPDLYSAGYKPNTITVTFKE